MKEALIIFVRNPEKGKVKTRIARTAGADRALAIYLHLLRATRRLTAQLPYDKWVFYDGFMPANDEWEEAVYHKARQLGEDLGARMKEAFRILFEKSYKNVVIIGSDCPELTPVILREAFEKLAHHDVVIGPAADGGYYLLGLTSLHIRLFENIDWSTGHVFSETEQRIVELGLRSYVLPRLHDIDEERDWDRYVQNRPAGKLLFVYNAGSDLFSTVTDWVHKLVSPDTYACSLCALTHGQLGMKEEWKSFLAGLPLRQEFLHKDQFAARYPHMASTALPAIFLDGAQGLLSLLPAQQLNSLQSLAALEQSLLTEIARHDLDHHTSL